MGWLEEFNELQKQPAQGSGNTGTSGGYSVVQNNGVANPFRNNYVGMTIQRLGETTRNAQLAPVRTNVTGRMTTNKKKKKEEDKSPLDIFQKGALKDGVNVKSVTKAILGTAGDVGLSVLRGAAGLGEGIGDAIVYGAAEVGDLIGMDERADQLRKNAQVSQVDRFTGGANEWLDKYSVMGDSVDGAFQGVGQMLGLAGATAGAVAAAPVTVPAVIISGGLMALSGIGQGYTEAYQGGATDEEARKHALNTGASDALSEMLFGAMGKAAKVAGLSKGLTSIDDVVAVMASKKFKSQAAKNLAEAGVKMSAEGLEEVISGTLQAVSKYNSYMSEEDFSKILKDENLAEQFFAGALTAGIMQSGYVPGMTEGSVREANKTGRDFITGQTQNEQAVIQKELEKRIAEAEKGDKKLTNKQKAAIEAEVVEDMEKGYLSIDTIEEVLGGETYNAYKNTIDSEDAQIKELEDQIKALSDEPNTVGNAKKYDSLTAKLEELKNNSQRDQMKSQLYDEVFNLAKGDRLAESYNERARRGQTFEADLTQYDENQQKVIQKAIDSGILNNTNRTHEFVDMIAKISADKGVLFDFTNNEKLKTSGFAVDGKTVNGYVTKDGVTLNIQSAKALNSVVGHEISHVLEGTELYKALRETVYNYAISKEGLDSFNKRLKATEELYKGMDADPDAELTADLIGDYLFTDTDFINRLSTENRNIFQKMYDEVKYLCKVATAGSKEARELENVKKTFEQVWRENATEKDGVETRYSLEKNGKGKYNKRSKHSESETLFMSWENGSAPVGEVKKFNRFGNTRYYEKTENGCVELSRSQYNERNGRNAEETYGRIQRQVNGIADPNGNSERNLSGSMDGDRDAGRTSAVSGQTFGEELRNDIAGSVSSDGGYTRGNGLTQTEYNDEASDESGASFVTFSNDYATIRNFMKEGDTDTQHSLSEKGEQHPVYGNYNVYGKDIALEMAPVRETAATEESSDISPVVKESLTTTPTVSKTESVEDIAPIDVAHSPVLKRLNQKLSNIKTELDENQKLREESSRSFDEKIADAKAQLEAKKNKDTKVANNLKRRIERLERLKADRDAEYAKRIGSIKSRISNIETSIQKYHPGLDRAEKAITRIDKALEADKAELTEEYNLKKEQLADKDSYISQKATELYNEIRNLKKGVRASEQLGYLLDHGYDWSSIKSALVNIKHTPGGTVNINSEAESVAREMLNEDYENSQYALEEEYLKQINELEAKADEKRKATSVANQRKTKMEEHSKRWENIVGDTSTWKDMSMGLSYKTKTLRRILRKVVKDANGNADIQKADRIYDELETKYDHHEAQLKQESQKLKEVFFELDLNHAEDTYAHMLGELKYNPETTLTEEVVKEYYDAHKGRIDTSKVNKAIAEARKTFDDLIVRVNDVLREQGMKEIPYRKGYFPHFTNPKQGWLAKLLNWKTIDNEIPTSIAGLTEMFTPQRSWQSFNKQRMGDKTDYSLYQGLDTYIHGALDWIYHIDDIQSRRALENHLRYTHSDEGVKARIEEIKANDTYDADETQKLIEGVLAEANNPLSGLVRELMNRTNTLANKKSSMDRGMEDATNRKIYSTMTNLNNRINANMVVGSFSSALTNFIPMVQSWHQVSPYFTVRGLGDFVRSSVRDDGMVAKSDFLTNRLVEEEKLYQTTWDKVSDKAAFMMNVIDNISSQTVWRSKYLQNIKEGMSEAQAIKDADQFSKNVMAGRSRGNAPTIFDAKNPLAKIFTAFQLEVANQYGYMFEDVPQDSKNTARLVKGYATAFLGAYAYNALYSSLVGRDAAFDPIGIIEDLLKDLFDDDDEEEGLSDELLNFGKSILEEVPFVGGLVGGGRVPMSSAFPYSGYTEPFESMVDDFDKKDWDSLGKEFLKPLYYLAMPVAGGQIKKTVEGLSMFSDEHPIAGSYTTSGNLRFPVEDTIANRIKAGLFGQYASENARKYFDEEHWTLYPEQTEILAGLDIPIEEYWEYRENLNALKATKDALKEAANSEGATAEDILKSRYASSVYSDIYKLYDQQVEIAQGDSKNKKAELTKLQRQMETMLAKTKSDMDNININGYYATIGDKRYDYSDYSGSWYEIKGKYLKQEQAAMKRYGISPADYWNNTDLYYKADWYFDDMYASNNRELIANTVFGGKRFAPYAAELGQIKGEDLDGDGKTDSGSKKDKVIDYINGLDMDYGEKIIMYRTMYSSKDDKKAYNQDIIDYLNSRDDITAQEMKSILEELDFEVDSNGNITW